MKLSWILPGIGLALLVAQAAAADKEPDIFYGGIGNAIVMLIVFSVVVYILRTSAWGPLLKALNEREQRIHGDLVKAKEEREEADKLLQQYKVQIDRSREEATAIVEEGRRDSEVVRQRIQTEAQAESKAMVERAKAEIELAANAAIKSVYDQSADIAVQVAGQVIRRELSASDHDAIIRETLDAIKSSQKARLN